MRGTPERRLSAVVDRAIGKDRLIETVDRLRAELARLPPSEPVQRAIYHCERLRLAVATSHSEGTRFAAFTVNKILRDRQAELPPDAARELEKLREELRGAGWEI